MNLIVLIFFGVIISISLFLFFMLFRNEWLGKERINLIRATKTMEELDEFNKLPSYHSMLYRFWIWDINKLKGDNHDSPSFCPEIRPAIKAQREAIEIDSIYECKKNHRGSWRTCMNCAMQRFDYICDKCNRRFPMDSVDY